MGKKVFVTKQPGGTLLSKKPIPVAKAKGIKTSGKQKGKPTATLKAPSNEVFAMQASRSMHAQIMDDALVAPLLPFDQSEKWLKAPNRFDLPGVDTKGSLGSKGKVTTVRVGKAAEEKKPPKPGGLSAALKLAKQLQDEGSSPLLFLPKLQDDYGLDAQDMQIIQKSLTKADAGVDKISKSAYDLAKGHTDPELAIAALKIDYGITEAEAVKAWNKAMGKVAAEKPPRDYSTITDLAALPAPVVVEATKLAIKKLKEGGQTYDMTIGIANEMNINNGVANQIVKQVQTQHSQHISLGEPAVIKKTKLPGTKKLISNLIESEKPLISTDLALLAAHGTVSKGYDNKNASEKYKYGGAKAGIFTDGYILIDDPKVAAEKSKAIFEQEAKAIAKKLHIPLPDAKDNVRQKATMDWGFPDIKKSVYPSDPLSLPGYKPFAVYAGTKDDPFTKYSPKAPLVYFTNDQGVIKAVNADKLAFIYKHIKPEKIVSQGLSTPIFFLVDDKIKAAIMPFAFENSHSHPSLNTAASRIASGEITQPEPIKARLGSPEPASSFPGKPVAAGYVKLQGVGLTPGLKADDLQPGQTVMWNGGATNKIFSIEKKSGTKYLVLTFHETDNMGNSYKRKLLRTRLVAMAPGQVEEPEGGKEGYYKEKGQKIIEKYQGKASFIPAEAQKGKIDAKKLYIAKDANDKPLIKDFNVKLLINAAEEGEEALIKASGTLSEKMLSPSKKAAIEDITNQLKAQLAGEAAPTETPSTSGEAEMIEAVKSGDVKLPKFKAPDTATLNEQYKTIAQDKKDWDADLEMISGKKGTNEGGLYKDKKLATFHYLKWPGEERGRMEALAAALYQLADVPVPSIDIIKYGGNWTIKSDWLPDPKPLTFSQMKNYPEVRNNLTVDAWLGNWDVTGTNADNIVLSQGIPYRIDLGGSLMYHAQGKLKDFPSNKVDEIENMTNPMVGKHAAQVFGGLTWDEKKKGAAKVAAVTDHMIDEVVDAYVPDGFTIPGLNSNNINVHLKKILKSRRDWIVENVLKYEPPKPLTAAQLKKLSALKAANIQKVIDHKDQLIRDGSTAVKKKVHDGVILDQLGSKIGQPAINAIEKNYGGWKGHTSGTSGQILRWASAEYMGRGPAVRQQLEKYWKAKGDNVETQIKEFDALIEKYGPATVNGVGVNNEMHKVLLRAQYTQPKGKKAKKDDTITLWRSWRPDQVSIFGWKDATPGDLIDVLDPLIFSFSLTRSVANNFYSGGGKMVKVEVPIDNVLMSDRLTNTGGGYQHEDEAVFVMPKGYTMEVVK